MSVSARLAVVVVLVAVVAAACSDDSAAPADESSSSSAELPPSTESVADGGPDESAVTTSAPDTSTSLAAATTTSVAAEPLTLEERITANMQGAQRERLDIWPDSEAGGVVFFHHGDWASEVVGRLGGTGEFTGDYCERGTYAWSVADAKSESEFTIHYDALIEDPDCQAFGIERLTAVFTGSREVDGRIIYDFGYTAGLGTPEQPLTGTRTVCSDQWNDPEPCGLALPGFEMSTPPN
jgi:hypothetical protein